MCVYKYGKKNNIKQSIHPFPVTLIRHRIMWNQGPFPRNSWHAGRGHPGHCANPLQGTIMYTFIHHSQFRDTKLTTVHVLQLGVDTGIPRGNPWKKLPNREKMQTLYRGIEEGIEPPPPEVWGKCPNNYATVPPHEIKALKWHYQFLTVINVKTQQWLYN